MLPRRTGCKIRVTEPEEHKEGAQPAKGERLFQFHNLKSKVLSSRDLVRLIPEFAKMLRRCNILPPASRFKIEP